MNTERLASMRKIVGAAAKEAEMEEQQYMAHVLKMYKYDYVVWDMHIIQYCCMLHISLISYYFF